MTAHFVQVNLYSIDGTLKYSTDCAPSNGFFLLQLHHQVCIFNSPCMLAHKKTSMFLAFQGEYLVKTVPPQGWIMSKLAAFVKSAPNVAQQLFSAESACSPKHKQLYQAKWLHLVYQPSLHNYVSGILVACVLIKKKKSNHQLNEHNDKVPDNVLRAYHRFMTFTSNLFWLQTAFIPCTSSRVFSWALHFTKGWPRPCLGCINFFCVAYNLQPLKKFHWQ